MITREDLKNHWNVVKNRLQQNWRELSDTQLAQFNSTPKDLISAIQRTTGASWDEVESFLISVLRDGRDASQRVGGLVDQYGEEGSQFVRAGYDQLAASTAEYSKKVARTVQRRPMESIAIAFGVGLVAGAVVLLSKRRS